MPEDFVSWLDAPIDISSLTDPDWEIKHVDDHTLDVIRDAYESLGLQPTRYKGAVSELAKTLAGSFMDQAIVGPANTLGKFFDSDSMQSWAQEYRATHHDWDKSPYGGVAGRIAADIGSGVGSTLSTFAAMGADALLGTGGVLTFSNIFLGSYGDNIDKYTQMLGEGHEAEAWTLAFCESGIDAATEIWLGTIPRVGRAFKGLSIAARRKLIRDMSIQALRELGEGGARKFAKAVAENAGEEFAEEFVQHLNSWAWGAIAGSGEEYDIVQGLDQALSGAIGGAALGILPAAGDAYRAHKITNSRQAMRVLRGLNAVAEDEGTTLAEAAETHMPENLKPSTIKKQQDAARAEADALAEKILPEVGKKFGLNIDFFDDPTKANGYRDENGIHLNKSHQLTFMHHGGHETFHVIEKLAPEMAQELREMNKSLLNDRGSAELRAVDNLYKAVLGDQYIEHFTGENEFTADSFGRLWAEPEYWKAVSNYLDEQKKGEGVAFLSLIQDSLTKFMAALKKFPMLPKAGDYFKEIKQLRDRAAYMLVHFNDRNNPNIRHTPVTDGKVFSVDIDSLNLDPARFQHRMDADSAGIVKENELAGEWNEAAAGNIYVWEDKNGKRWVVNGHHRFALAKAKGVKKINAYIEREVDGVSAEEAYNRGTELNILDDSATVQEYAQHFRRIKMDRATADRRGYLEDNAKHRKARNAWFIATYASDNLYEDFMNGDIPADKAAAIAEVAQGDTGLERVGISAAPRLSAAQLKGFMRQAQQIKENAGDTGTQLDLFGEDDSIIKELEAIAKAADRHIKEINQRVSAAKAAVKNPAAAEKMGVHVGAEAQALLDQALADKAAWEHYETNPELMAQLRSELGLGDRTAPAPKPEPAPAPEPEAEPAPAPADENTGDLLGEPEEAPAPKPETKPAEAPKPAAEPKAKPEKKQKPKFKNGQPVWVIDDTNNNKLTETTVTRGTSDGKEQVDGEFMYTDAAGNERAESELFASKEAAIADYRKTWGRDPEEAGATPAAENATPTPAPEPKQKAQVSTKANPLDEFGKELMDKGSASLDIGGEHFDVSVIAGDGKLIVSVNGREIDVTDQVTENTRDIDLLNLVFDLMQETAMNNNISADIRDIIFSGGSAKDRRAALDRYAKENDYTSKEIEEMVEHEYVRTAHDIMMDDSLPFAQKLNLITAMYNDQIPLNTRDSARVNLQQYSTPLPLAAMLNQMLDIRNATSVYEPTAGNGSLVIGADPKVVHVNELDAGRLANLQMDGYRLVTNEDATVFVPKQKNDVIIANPPFGKLDSPVKVNGYTINRLDQLIIAKALTSLTPDGRAAIIMGANLKDTAHNKNEMPFVNMLNDLYKVEKDFVVDGKLYAKQGTTYPIRVMVVKGKQNNISYDLKRDEIGKITSYSDLANMLLGGNNATDRQNNEAPPEGVVLENGAGVGPADYLRYVGQRRSAANGGTNRVRSEGSTGNGSRTGVEGSAVGSGNNVQPGNNSGGRSTTIREISSFRRALGLGESTGRKWLSGLAQGIKRERPDVGERPQQAPRPNETVRSPGRNIPGEHRAPVTQRPEAQSRTEQGSTPEPEVTPAPVMVNQPDPQQNQNTQPAKKEKQERKLTRDGMQATYVPHSDKNPLMNVVVPLAIEQELYSSLDRLKAKVVAQGYAGIDDFVAKKLGYPSVEAMTGLAADQVDAVALAIDSIDNGGTMIIADQTGIGKGRVGAAIIRYAKKLDCLPVFLTAKPELFSDSYGDCKDIGESITPLAIASNTKNANIVDKNDGNRLLFRAASPRSSTVESFLAEPQKDHKQDVVYMSYSMISNSNNGRSLLTRLVENNRVVFIMDEAHKVAGIASGRASGINTFFTNLKNGETTGRNIAGSMMLSATYAKRPENLVPFLIFTGMDTKLDPHDRHVFKGETPALRVASLIERGGVALLEAFTKMLADSGIFIRRERSYDGVKFDCTPIDVGEEGVRIHDAVVDVLGEMNVLSIDIENALPDMIPEGWSLIRENETSQTDQAVQTSAFASTIHNYIDQMILCLAIKEHCKRLIERVRQGKKVIYPIQSTVGSALTEYIGDIDGFKFDETEIAFTYRDVLHAKVNALFTRTLQNPQGDRVKIALAPTEELAEAVQELHAMIDATECDFPASPIDVVRKTLADAGIKTDEITGRDKVVDYADSECRTGVVRRRKANINDTINNFNNGDTQVLVINEAGSTGWSGHSDPRFKTGNMQRSMIVGQAHKDINILMQIFGRIFRSGATILPEYFICFTNLQAEVRAQNVLMKKLYSLNAATSGNKESTIALNDADMDNHFGDEAALQVLEDNPGLENRINLHLRRNERTGEVEASSMRGLFMRLTGKMRILHNDVQKNIYEQLRQKFANLIEIANATDTNDLGGGKVKQWQARDIEVLNRSNGDPNGPLIDQPFVLKRVAVNETLRVASRKTFDNDRNKYFPGKTDEQGVRDTINQQMDKRFDEARAYWRARKAEVEAIPEDKRDARDAVILRYDVEARIREMRQMGLDPLLARLDSIVSLNVEGGAIPSVFSHLVFPKSSSLTNPLSGINISFLTRFGAHINIPLERISDRAPMSNESFETYFNEKERETFPGVKTVITGNVFRAIAENHDMTFSVIQFTEEGKTSPTPGLLIRSMGERRSEGIAATGQVLSTQEQVFSALIDAVKHRGNYLRVSNGMRIYPHGRKVSSFNVWTNRNTRETMQMLDQLNPLASDRTDTERTHSLEFDNRQNMERAIGILMNGNNISYDLRRDYSQINPIFTDNGMKEIYDEALATGYTPETINGWLSDALDFITDRGGIEGAVTAILDGDIPTKMPVLALVRRYILNSEQITKLPPDIQKQFMESEKDLRHMWGQLGRALRQDAMTLDSFEKVSAMLKRMTEDFSDPQLRALRDRIRKKLGIDILDLPEDIVADRNKLDKVLREIMAERATWNDKAYEYWVNALLSAPATHAVNTVGNVFNAAYELGIKRIAEATINSIFHVRNGATFKEIAQMWKAVDWKEAWRRAKLAIDFETITADGKLDEHGVAIGGEKGRYMRTPTRFLRFADEIAKAVVQPMEAAAYAYREARRRKLSPDKAQAYIQKSLANQNSLANHWGRQRALELTFQERGENVTGGKIIDHLISLKASGNPIARYMLPFIRTPHNIIRQGVRKSPLGALNLAWQTGKAVLGKRAFDAEYQSLVAEQLIAWSALMMLAAGYDEDDPWITGSAAPYGTGKQKFEANKIPPYSIKIGGKWLSYRRVEPFSTALSMMVDTIELMHGPTSGKDATAAFKTILGGMRQTIVEKSFMDSLHQINDLVFGTDKKLSSWGSSFIASWVPAVVRNTTLRSFDDKVRDHSTGNFFEVVATKSGIPMVAPKRDYFGREIKKDAFDDMVIGPLNRMLGIEIQDSTINRADRMLLNYSRTSDTPYYPTVPSRTFKVNGVDYEIAPKAYESFVRESGQLALKQINNAFAHGVLDSATPTEHDIDIVKKVFARARKETREKFIIQNKARKVK